MGYISAQQTRYSHLISGFLMFAILLVSAGSANAGTVINQCSDCHAIPPADGPRKGNPNFRSYSSATQGNHETHLSGIPLVTDCTVCHVPVSGTSFGHQNNVINMAYSIKGYSSASIRAKYNKGVFFNQTSLPVLNTTATCSNVNCHFETPTDTWGATPFSSSDDCWACHSVPGTSAPHARHNEYYSFADNGCSRCHSDHLTGLRFSHATSAGGRGIDVALDDGTYSGNGLNYLPSQSASRVFGSCNGNYCHSNGKGGVPNVTPVWGGSVTLNCRGCHGDAASTGSAALYGRHDSHVNNAAYLGTNYGCIDCHASTVSGDTAIKDKSKHVNSFVDYSGSKAGQNFSDCSNIYCHSDGKGVHVDPGLWTAAVRTPDCKLCHGSKTTAQGAAFTSNAGEPNYANGGAGTSTANSHEKHTAIGATSCQRCHSTTTATGTAIISGSAHISGAIDVVQGSGYTFSYLPGDKSCTTSSCHSGGGIITNPPVSQWGGTFTCISCHGDATSGTLSGKHAAHVNNAAVIGTNFGCVDCHAKTVSNNTTISTSANHLNSFVDYSGVKAGKSSTYTTATGVCSASYCHSDGKGTAKSMAGDNWKAATTLDCKGCHGSAVSPDFTSSAAGEPNYVSGGSGTLSANSHKKHTTTGVTSCVNCHSATTVTGTAIVYGSPTHIDQALTVTSNGAIAITYTAGTKTCSATYCHSNVQAPGGGSAASTFGTPVWGGSAMSCASCHADMSTLLTEDATNLALGSHKRHVTDAGFSCSLCHAGDTAASTGPLHTDGTINVNFTSKGVGTTYSQAVGNVPGNGYGTCSTSKCHGRGTPNWGLNTSADKCEKCHGSAATAAAGSFKDTAGSTGSVYVGTHVSHLKGTHNYSLPITCDQCHTVPASVTAFGHMSSLPATLTWGVLAKSSSKVRTTAGSTSGVSTSMAPSYSSSGRQCSNTYCHAGVQNFNGTTYSPQGTGPAPLWGDPAYLGGSGCDKCHGYPPGGVHTASTSCNACHNHVAASNNSFADKTKHINGTVETTADDCIICHSTCASGDASCIDMKLVGAHNSHTGADLFLTGKKLSAGDYTDQSWIYSIQYVKGVPKYGCGFCHPMDAGTHKNSLIELDMDPSHSLAGTVKTKNKAGGPWYNSTTGVSVVCSNIYCHSNGYITSTSYRYKTTPDWYATAPWASVDKCSQCHGNSPAFAIYSGSSAHGRHVVASHYKNVYSNYSGKLAVAGVVGSGAVHGDPATSTTFNCNVCHFSTVKNAFNDKGSICSSCHVASGSAALKGTMNVYSSNTTHVNGVADVVFMDPFVIKSKAQVRDSIATVSQLNASWTRVKGFKTMSSHDVSRTTPQYNKGTCSTVACHNGTRMEWATPGPLLCAACHVDLTQ